eukprot:CAMPEP_0115649950 /NCGR_PEP_ID=MMETSP0272-20121206/40764_1 /TAXON_ID=71861 /ORGANISM="Scrippsiella trochoidea, Strain CCMP3099" /LENGTH=48 /DNA_ID= /DNA_START= /DNA_END= /DNA_ORIENTATION=
MNRASYWTEAGRSGFCSTLGSKATPTSNAESTKGTPSRALGCLPHQFW